MSGPVQLAFSVFGRSSGVRGVAPLVVLHGLFGSSRNWRTLAGRLAAGTNRLVYTIDARNHGESPHTHDMSYDLMSTDLTQFCQSHDLEKVVLMGHSMGGKTAMLTALREPDLVERLVVLDVSPRAAPGMNATVQLLGTLQRLDLSQIRSRRDADAALKGEIPDAVIREFLLTNLTPEPSTGKMKWRTNLDAIGKYMERLKSGVPICEDCQPFHAPTLFLGGKNSSYITARDIPEIQRLFPSSLVRHIPGAGHWLHFEKPTEFLSHVTHFITSSA